MVLFRRSGLLKNRNLIFLRPKNHYKHGNELHRMSHSTALSESEHTELVTLSDGKTMTLSTGKYAQLANGCVIAKFGDTSVMATAVRGEEVDTPMVPLTVDYRQTASAGGRIPTNFLRRELRNTDQEILTGRIIDRSVRPLFEQGYNHNTQLICKLLAVDGVHDPGVLCINAASAVLSISDVPWNGPIGAVRVGLIDNECISNPTKRELQQSTLNLIATYTSKSFIVMLEGSANDVLEQDLRKAIRFAAKDCNTIVQSINNLQKIAGKPKIEISKKTEISDDVKNFVKEFSENEIHKIFTCYTHDKFSRDNAISDLRIKLISTLENNGSTDIAGAKKAFDELVKEVLRSLVINKDKRCDGRTLDELRNINCQVELFSPLHGSAFFQRGQTQVLCTVTLDCIETALKMDSITMLTSGVKEKNFFLHYHFPPYATNSIGRVTGSDRREIGHGALAEKGLRSVIPQNYPFAIRLTSEVLQSNGEIIIGSSSMATVCGGSMALMNAGVPISSPVAGVAIGLMCEYDYSKNAIKEYKILTDILGIEDYMGDMDFKIAGTKRGFTALQMDIKLPGIPAKIVMESIHKAMKAKTEIINIMNRTISSPRNYNTKNQPLVESIEIPVHQRSKFFGVGGINLKKMFFEMGVQIYPSDDNKYSIFAPNHDTMNEAQDIINKFLTKNTEPELIFGEIYTAKIVALQDIGVLVTLNSSMTPTLLHNSQLDRRRIHHPSVLGLEVGQELLVKYFGRDPVNGQIRLSHKVLQEGVEDC